MFDLLITDGLLFDGTGNVGFFGTIGIEGDRLTVLRGDPSDIPATRTISAKGKVACPGFIDLHAHSALMALAEPRLEPKIHQGVTTELLGIDGLSYAPIPDWKDVEDLIVFNAGLEGHPDISQRWSSVDTYLEQFDGRTACNV